jgi:phosphatidylserine/phosphatidylglycerophosphate/cardiolipin synthase-like enzyme
MDEREIDAVLEASFADGQLSRGERSALRELVAEKLPRDEQRGAMRRRAFALVERRVEGALRPDDVRAWLGWLEDVVRISIPEAPRPTRMEVLDSPGDRVWRRIVELAGESRSTLDVCVFTITHDPITRALLDAHRRGVRVRVISDGEKSVEPGSDVRHLAAAGLDVRVDRCEHHMHHKFATFDARVLVTGSYNWTRAAAESNQDNVLVTDDPRAIGPYRAIFEKCWAEGVPFA